ncbi:LysR family transcriptional regulator [Actinoplanes sp. NPDC026670]|uniref:LysR family transcriptional regulator n=1 Tax=Actinoplanes sp. NPDC026670 TaxID=3154700 RepID=UPI0033C6AF5E
MPAARLDQEDPRLLAQRWVDARLDSENPMDSTDLTDLHTLAKSFHRHVKAPYLLTLADDKLRAVRERGKQLRGIAVEVGLVADAAARTVELLTCTTDDDTLRCLAPLVGAGNIIGRWRLYLTSNNGFPAVSHQRTRQFLTACDSKLRFVDRVRFGTCTDNPAIPDAASTARARSRMKCLPQFLWQDWLARFQPRKGIDADVIGSLIPSMLLVPGNADLNSTETHDFFNWGYRGSRPLEDLAKSHPDTLRAVWELARYLDAHGSPIDYERRRSTFANVAMCSEDWRSICSEIDEDPGRERRYHNAQRFVYRLLTGADLRDPSHPLAFTTFRDKRSYNWEFEPRISAAMKKALTEYAEAKLAAEMIIEPLIWSPPMDCITGLNLAGELADIDLSQVARAVQARRRSVSQVAGDFGINEEHVRYALSLFRPGSSNARNRSFQSSQERGASLLSRDFFEREYVLLGKDLATMSVETGIPRYLIITHGKTAGFDVRKPLPFARGDARKLPKYMRQIIQGNPQSLSWLRRFRRCVAYPSLTAAAHAFKCNNGALGKQIRSLEMAIGHRLLRRGRGGRPMTLTSQGQQLVDDLNQPAVLALLEEPTGGWSGASAADEALSVDLLERSRLLQSSDEQGRTWLSRFQQVARHDTLREAAADLGITLGRLSTQITQLELALDAKLIDRARRGLPMSLTAAGIRLLAQLERRTTT